MLDYCQYRYAKFYYEWLGEDIVIATFWGALLLYLIVCCGFFVAFCNLVSHFAFSTSTSDCFLICSQIGWGIIAFCNSNPRKYKKQIVKYKNKPKQKGKDLLVILLPIFSFIAFALSFCI